jgi:hypothetical protein
MDGSYVEVRANLDYTLSLAEQILQSTGTNPLDAFMKGVGTLERH